MIGLLWLVLCAIIGVPMIISPQKILERPACKIKSAGMIRACGVLIIVIGIIMALL